MKSKSALIWAYLLAIAAISTSGSPALAADMTWGTYCSTVINRCNGVSDKAIKASLCDDYQNNCIGEDQARMSSPFDGVFNPNFYSDAVNPLEDKEVKEIIDVASNADETKYTQFILQWKYAASRLHSDCVANTGTALSAVRQDYSTVMSMLGGTTVENGCSKISTFQSNAEIRLSDTAATCKAYSKKCYELGNNDNQSIPTASQRQVITEAQNLCAAIATHAANAQAEVQTKAQQLNSTCVAARQETGNKDVVEKKNDTNNLLNQAAQALPQIASMLQNQGGAMPMPQQQKLQVPQMQFGQPSAGAPPVVGKGQGLDGSTNNSDMYLPLGDDVLDMGNGHVRKANSQWSSGGSGGGGGAGVSANSPNPAPAPGRGGGGRGGSRYDTTVNSGFQVGSVGGLSGSKPGGGYPDNFGPGGSGAGRIRGKAPQVAQDAAALRARLAALRPAWVNQRKIAGATGPDGITGPHTDLFRKVRIRYEAVVLDLD